WAPTNTITGTSVTPSVERVALGEARVLPKFTRKPSCARCGRRAPLGWPVVRVLLIGSGGREHALALGLAADPSVDFLAAAPGSPGIAQVVSLDEVVATDSAAVAALAVELAADLVVVGPEAPLVAGVADAVRAEGIACFGPSAAAAQLEGSKAFAK